MMAERSPNRGIVYLIPSTLHDDSIAAIPGYINAAVAACSTFFVENERSARRFLKRIWKEIRIDDYRWVTIHKAEDQVKNAFIAALREGSTVGIISEAGCPGVADPGQTLVLAAHQANADVRPLVGPSSIVLALMAGGLNGQQFRFRGYLPIETPARIAMIRQLEADSSRSQCTQLFIETPYRNNQLMQALLDTCAPRTWLSIAVDLTAPGEWVRTMRISEWKTARPDLHKKPVVFSLLA